MNKIIKQFMGFLLISGTGWLMDVGVYSIFTMLLGINIFFSNTISSILAITFVFCISTKKIFVSNNNKISLKMKYVIYFIYQLILIVLISLIMQKINFLIVNHYKIEVSYLKLIIKIVVTPITMILNFFVLKILSEKI